MFNLLDLQQQRAHKSLTANELIERSEKAEGGARPMSADEIVIFDRLTEEVGKLDEQIAAVEAHQRRAVIGQKLIADLESPAPRKTTPDAPASPAASGGGSFRIPAQCRRTGVLKAFKGADADARAYRAGMWIRAVLLKDVRAQQFCLTQGIGSIDIRNAMSTTSNTDGGFLVPEEMSQTIIDLREQYGIFRRETRVVPMGRDTMMIPRRLGGITIGSIGENPSSAISQSNPTFNQVQLVAKKCGGLTLMSTEVAEDAVIDLADWIAQEFAYGFANFEDTCGFVGTGVSAHLGIRGLVDILTEASGLAGAVAAVVGHDLFSEIDNTDLTTLMGKLPQYARAGAKFYCSSVAADLVFSRLKAVAGGNSVQTLQGNLQENYLGFPIVISQVLPSAVTTLDTLPMILFGNLQQSSTMGDRREVRIFPSEHRYMDTDQIGIRGTERIDIVNHDVGDSTTPGPMLSLTGNTA